MFPDPGPAARALAGFPENDRGTKRSFGEFVGGRPVTEKEGELKICYGTADTVECLATANVHDLAAACLR